MSSSTPTPRIDQPVAPAPGSEQHGAKAHSDGGWDAPDAAKKVPVQTRSERPQSGDLDAFAPVTGREVNWKFAPIAKLQPLLDGGLDGSAYPFLARQTEGADVEWGRSDDPAVGTAGLPEDRAAAAAWTARDAVLKVTVKATEAHESISITRSDFGTQARAAHTVITAEQHAQGIVVIDNRGSALLSENVEIVVRDGARLTVVSLQDWDDDAVHVSTQFAEVGRDAFLKHVVVSLGGDVVRVNPSTHLGAQGADTEMYGVYFADAGQYIEQQVYVNHDAPNTRGRVNYKGALQGEARTRSGSATCSSAAPATAPTRTSRTATSCSPTARARTASRTSRSRPATSRVPATPAPPVGSTTSSCSTCRPAASPRKKPVASSSWASWWRSSRRSARPSSRSA